MSLRVIAFGKEPPPLANLDEYVAFMEERGIDVIREWVAPSEEFDYDPFWDTCITKEQALPDGRLYMQTLQVSDQYIAAGWRETWEHEADLLEAALGHGVAQAMAVWS